MNSSLSYTQSSKIYLRLRVRRTLNMISSGFLRKKHSKAGDTKRTANAGKAKTGFLAFFGLLYLIAMLLSNVYFGTASLRILFPDPNEFVAVFAVKFLIQFASISLLSLGNRELGRTDSDIEWLATLPAPWPLLLLGKMIERAFFNVWFIMLLGTLIGGKYSAGMNLWLAVSTSFCLLVPLVFTSAMVQIFIEYSLRVNCGPAQLRNIQASIAIVSIVPFFTTMAPGTLNKGFWVKALEYLPHFVLDSAPAKAARIGMDSTLNLPLALISYGLQIVILISISIWGLTFALKKGVVGTSQRETTRDSLSSSPAIKKHRLLSDAKPFFSPVIRRELTLLRRDRTLLVQTIVLPIIMLGAQLFPLLNAPGSEPGNFTFLSTLIFISLCSMLSFSSFQTLNSEGQALWILYALPSSIEAIIKKKLALWIAVTMAMVVLVFASLHFGLHVTLTKKQIFDDGAILFGAYLYGWMALALGIFGSNPLAEDVQRRTKPSSMIYFMSLLTFYIPVFHMESYRSAAILIALLATLSYALWQEAKSYLPYLLDPVSAPPSRVSLAHGSVAAVMFFLFQIVIAFFLSLKKMNDAALILLSYSGGGAIIFAIMKIYFWRKKTADIPVFYRITWLRNILTGLLAGWVLGGFGLAYVKLNLIYHWFAVPTEPTVPSILYGLIPLTVIAAPFFEEYIFRGLVFQGLKRSFPLWFSVISSALIFAIIHPPLAFPPVFALGVTTAILYHRTRALTASIVTHGIYNLIVVCGPLLCPQVFS